MQKSFRILLALALIAAGFWGWRMLFPSPEKVIRSRLSTLAKTVSSESGQGTISQAYNLQKIPDFVTPDIEIDFDVRGYPPIVINGREDLMQAVMLFKSHRTRIKVEFLDVNIAFSQDQQSAVANLTCKVTPSDDRDFMVQEANFHFKKVDGQWLIYKVETVKTLSQQDSGESMIPRHS